MAASIVGKAPSAGMVGSPLATRGGPGGRTIGEAFAEGVQPDHLAPDFDGLGEKVAVGGQRNAQPRLLQVFGEALDIGGVSGDGGDVGHYVLWLDRSAESRRQFRENRRRDVGSGGLRVRPQGKNSAAERTFEVVEIGDEAGKA